MEEIEKKLHNLFSDIRNSLLMNFCLLPEKADMLARKAVEMLKEELKINLEPR